MTPKEIKEKLDEEDVILKVERDFSSEYFISLSDGYYSIVINSEEITDKGESAETIISRVCEESASEAKTYEFEERKSEGLERQVVNKLFRGETNFGY